MTSPRLLMTSRRVRRSAAALTMTAVVVGAAATAQAASPTTAVLGLASQAWSVEVTGGTRKVQGAFRYEVPVPTTGQYTARVELSGPVVNTEQAELRIETSTLLVPVGGGITVLEATVGVNDGALSLSLGPRKDLPAVRRVSVLAASSPSTPEPSITTEPAPSLQTPVSPAPDVPSAPVVTRDRALQPFAATSIWNLPIAQGATFESASAPRTANLLGGDATTWLNQGQYSHPVVQASAGDPVATVTDIKDSRRSSTYRIPADAAVAAGSDKHLHVVTPDKTAVHEAWYVQRNSSTAYRVGRHHRVDLNGSGIGPQNGTRAYGGSAIGGLIRSWEVDPTHPAYTGRISHPIAMALRGDQLRYDGGLSGYDDRGYGNSKGYVWPATEQDARASEVYKGSIPMGSYFAIPPTVDVSALGLSPQGLMLARAYQDFGGYVTDYSGATILGYVEPSAPWAFSEALLGPNWTASDLRKIRAQLRLVTSNSAATPNGGPLDAPRRAPLQP